MRSKRLKNVIVTSLLATSAVTVFTPSDASASENTAKRLVEQAIDAGTVLKWAISIEGSGDGKTRPWQQYNAAKDAYAKAKPAVDKLPAAQRDVYLAQLEEKSVLHINRAMAYIDAITAGEKINEKKAILKGRIDLGLLDKELESAYHDLSSEIRKQAILLDRVYGQTTRDLIRDNYKKTAEDLRNSVMYAITVKIHLDHADTLIGDVANLPELNSIVDNINRTLPLVTNEVFLQQLTQRFAVVLDYVRSHPIPIPPPGIDIKVELTIPEIKQTLTLEAIKRGIPPEVIKSIVHAENSELKQFNDDGTPFVSWDGGIGIMQVTLAPTDNSYDREKLKWDTVYNIQAGADILLNKWNYGGKRTPTVNDNDKSIIENWYFAIMAYNGLSKKNDPSIPENNPYQLKVFNWMDRYTGLTPEIIPGSEVLTTYAEDGRMLFTDKMNYTTTKKTQSTQMYVAGDQVVLSGNSNLRIEPRTGVAYTVLPATTTVTILEGPFQDSNYVNLFSWYKVRVNETGAEGYIASLNLQ
ncbi:hypothetical protein IM538_21435 [Cytobacillus suaedae]|nr:hypothetical protein IM538_21435 [Cytobacillus suaedae]